MSLITSTSLTDKCSAITYSIFLKKKIPNYYMFCEPYITATVVNTLLTLINDQLQILTRRAFFLNLFITENCLSLGLTISPNGTFGAFFAFCNHGCSVVTKDKGKLQFTYFIKCKHVADTFCSIDMCKTISVTKFMSH